MPPRVLALLVSLAVGGGCGRISFDALGDAAGPQEDAAPSIDADLSNTVYGDFTDVANWSALDLTTVTAGASGYVGAVFDGRYLYLVPTYNGTLHGIVARYDTQAAFTSTSSWTTFDTTTVDTNARGFDGSAFDGRYLYLAGHENNTGFDGVVARYDTQAAFGTASSWATFDTATVDPNAIGFYSARFDGRYVHFGEYTTGVMARYDTQGAFGVAASWTTFDVSTVNASIPAYVGSVFDGRYINYAPFFTSSGPSGLFGRYDTQAPLSATSSWTMFDATTVDPKAKGFCGAAFDGRYVYLIPQAAGSGVYNDTVVRLDTTANVTAASAWTSFALTTINPNAKGFFGATFDGRYLYLAPYPNNVAARYDTTQPFTSAAAWSTFVTSSVVPAGTAYYGAAFDGAAVYLVPHGGSTVLRFAAKTPASMPALPGFGGSFL